ncbi:MAG: M48 family metalloprotease [Alphaproteobacteria bacterium]
MPSARRGLGRGLAPPLALALVLAAPAPPARAFLDSINPFTDTKDEFEGRFADTLEPGPWKPALERLAAERAARDAEAGSQRQSGGGSEERGGRGSTASGEPAGPRPPPDPIPGGLTLLRIGEDSVAHTPAWEDYLDGIGARLMVGSPVTGVPLRYYVTASEDYPAAKAYPDGAVGIPIGLLRQVESEDELAFVLGHEAAHVILGHHDSDWFQSINQNMVSAAEMALGLGVALSQKLGKGGLAEDAAKFTLIAGAALFVADKGLFPSFTREQEDEADLLGLDLMVRGGYNSLGAFDAFAKIQAWEAALAKRGSPQDEKRAEMEREIAQSAQSGAADQLVQSVLKLFAFAVEEVGEKIGVSHRSAAAREESLLDYFFREYAEEVPPDSSALQLESMRSSAEGQELFNSYGFARGARKRVAEGKLKEAEQLSRKAVGGNFKNDSLTRYAFFETRLRQGQFDKARRNLELALEGPRPTLAVYRELAGIHWVQGRRKQAMAVLETAFETFQKPPELYADLIYRHYQLGDKKKADEMAVKCKFRNRGAGKVCGKAAKGENPRPADVD